MSYWEGTGRAYREHVHGDMIATSIGSWERMVNELGNLAWSFIDHTAQQIIDTIGGVIKQIFDAGAVIWDALSTTVQNIINNASAWIGTIIENIKNIGAVVWEHLSSTVQNIINSAAAWIGTIIEAIKNAGAVAWGHLSTAVQSIINNASAWLGTIIENIKNTGAVAWNHLATAVQNTINNAGAWIGTIIETIKNAGAVAWNQVTKTYIDICNTLGSWANMVNQFGPIATTFLTGIIQASQVALSSLADGFFSGLAGLAKFATGFFTADQTGRSKFQSKFIVGDLIDDALTINRGLIIVDKAFRIKESAMGNYSDIWLQLIEDIHYLGIYNPFFYVDQGFWCRKDLFVQGFVGSASRVYVTFGSNYTPCVPSDIGKVVKKGNEVVGTLTDYDNTAKKWWLIAFAPIPSGSSLTIPSGTGAGVTNTGWATQTGGGAFMIGHGLTGVDDPPKIILSSSALGFDTLNVLSVDNNPAKLRINELKLGVGETHKIYRGSDDAIRVQTPSDKGLIVEQNLWCKTLAVDTQIGIADVNLYRYAQDVLKTDDNFVVGNQYLNLNPESGTPVFNLNVGGVNKGFLAFDGSEVCLASASGIPLLLYAGNGVISAVGKLLVEGESAPSLECVMTASWTGRWRRGLLYSAPNMGSGSDIMISLGKSDDTRNIGQMYFHWEGNGSTSNFLGFGLYAVDDVLKIMGDGSVIFTGGYASISTAGDIEANSVKAKGGTSTPAIKCGDSSYSYIDLAFDSVQAYLSAHYRHLTLTRDSDKEVTINPITDSQASESALNIGANTWTDLLTVSRTLAVAKKALIIGHAALYNAGWNVMQDPDTGGYEIANPYADWELRILVDNSQPTGAFARTQAIGYFADITVFAIVSLSSGSHTIKLQGYQTLGGTQQVYYRRLDVLYL